MITSNFGKTHMRGNASMILTEFSCIVDSLKDCLIHQFGMDEKKAEGAIQHAYELGLKMEEEQNQRSTEEDELKEFLGELFGRLAKDLKGGASK